MRPPGLTAIRNKLPFRANGHDSGNGAPQTVEETPGGNGKVLEGNGRPPTRTAKLLPLRAWRVPGFSPKAFSERNPYIIGSIALAIILVFTAGSLFLQSGIFTSTFETTALFPNTAGIAANDQVMVAGIKVGKVGAAHLDGNQVRVALDINSGTQVPADSTAEVKIESFLGTKAVYLNPGTDWAHQLHQGSVITKTKVPFDLNQLANTAVPALNQTNSAQINELLGDLQAVTQGQRGNVTTIIDNLNGLTTTVNQRQAEVSVLLDSANKLVGTLNGRSAELASILYNLNVVVQGLAQRKTALAQLIDSTDQAASQLSGLIGANRPKLQAILNEVHTDLQIIDSRQVDLTQGLGYAAVAVNGFSSIGYVGPEQRHRHAVRLLLHRRTRQRRGVDVRALRHAQPDLRPGPAPRPGPARSGALVRQPAGDRAQPVRPRVQPVVGTVLLGSLGTQRLRRLLGREPCCAARLGVGGAVDRLPVRPGRSHAVTGRGRHRMLARPLRRRGRTVAATAVVACLGLAASACSGLTGGSSSTYSLQADFSRGDNLFAPTPVKELGVPIGTVTSVANQGDHVVAKMSIDQKYPLPADVRADLTQDTLLSQGFVQMSPGYTGGPQLPSGSLIPVARTSVPATTDELLASLNKFLGSINPPTAAGAVNSLATVLQGNGAQLNSLIHNASGTIGLLAQKGNELGQLLGAVGQLTGTLDKQNGLIGQFINNYNTVSGVLADNRNQLAGAINHLNDATVQATGLLQPNLGPLQQDVGNLTSLSRGLDRNLNSLDQSLYSIPHLFGEQGYDPAHNWEPINLGSGAGLTAPDFARGDGRPPGQRVPAVRAGNLERGHQHAHRLWRPQLLHARSSPSSPPSSTSRAHRSPRPPTPAPRPARPPPARPSTPGSSRSPA